MKDQTPWTGNQGHGPGVQKAETEVKEKAKPGDSLEGLFAELEGKIGELERTLREMPLQLPLSPPSVTRKPGAEKVGELSRAWDDAHSFEARSKTLQRRAEQAENRIAELEAERDASVNLLHAAKELHRFMPAQGKDGLTGDYTPRLNLSRGYLEATTRAEKAEAGVKDEADVEFMEELTEYKRVCKERNEAIIRADKAESRAENLSGWESVAREAEARIAALEAELAEAKAKAADFQIKWADADHALLGANHDLTQAVMHIDVLEADKHHVETECARAALEMDKDKIALTNAYAENEELEVELAGSEECRDVDNARLLELEKELDVAKNHILELEEQRCKECTDSTVLEIAAIRAVLGASPDELIVAKVEALLVDLRLANNTGSWMTCPEAIVVLAELETANARITELEGKLKEAQKG